MATLVIATTPGAPYHSLKTRLDGRDFILKLAFNQRQNGWSLSIFDEEEDPIVQGIRLIENWPLLRFYRSDPRCPLGELMVFDLLSDKSGGPPGLDELGPGKRCELTYFEAST